MMMSAVAPPQASVSVQSGSAPPWVMDVFVSGTAWSQDFLDLLETQHRGLAAYGHRVSTGSIATILPWVNVNRLTVRFTHYMVVKAEDLRIRGVTTPTHDVALIETKFDARSYTTTATFAFAGDLSRPENLLIEVNGDPGGAQSRDGRLLDGDRDNVPGGDFVFRLQVVPGGLGGGYVAPSNFQEVRARLGTAATDERVAPPYYVAVADSNADGRINALDLALVRRRMGTYGPSTQPSLTATASVSSPLRTRPAARDLFGSTPVLA